MAHSSYRAAQILNHEFRTATAPKLTTVWVGLLIAGVELTIGVGGYARFSLAVADAQWTAPAPSGSNYEISNVNAWTFGTASAGLGTPDGYAYYDASTAGNMLRRGTIGTPREILSGDTIQIPAGAITATVAFTA
jgi:hypothetical protein